MSCCPTSVYGAGTTEALYLAHIAAGTVHTFANRGPGQTRNLAVMTPELDELITALHSEPGASPDEIWARYNASVVPAP